MTKYQFDVAKANTNCILPVNLSKDLFLGIMPVSPIHLGYEKLFGNFFASAKKLDALPCIFFADIHAQFLRKLTPSQLTARVGYYSFYINRLLGFEADFTNGSEIQKTERYIEAIYSVVGSVPLSSLRTAAPRAMKKSKDSENFALLYLLMQCLDPLILGSETVFAEFGQKKIYELTDMFFPEERPEGITFPNFVFVDSAYDIKGLPIQESTSETRISVHDSILTLQKKIDQMYAPPGEQVVENGRQNPILEYFEWSVFPFESKPVRVLSEVENRVLEFNSFSEFASAYRDSIIHPAECKAVLKHLLIPRLRHYAESFPHDYTSWIVQEQ
jgi:tyrosyl-tRNA synthetase